MFDHIVTFYCALAERATDLGMFAEAELYYARVSLYAQACARPSLVCWLDF